MIYREAVSPAKNTEPAARPARRRLPPDDRRQALINSALKLFNTHPYDEVSVDDIAAEAGMSRPLVYHYYGGKAGVFISALRQTGDDVVAAVGKAGMDDPDNWLTAGLSAFFDHIQANPIGLTALYRHGSLTGLENRRVLDEMDSQQNGAPSLSRLCYGSAPTPGELLFRARTALPDVRFMQFYGVTEGGFVSVLTHADHVRGFAGETELLTSCGRPGPRAEVQIVDENSEPLKRGERGEVWLRSAMNCNGYHRLPAETSQLLSAGWVRTNDIGWMDDEGFLYLTDRKNFVIITGGMNVYPSAVERVLSEHPMISEAAVVGVEHEDWGQAVVAIVEARSGCAPDPADLIAFSRERLGSFQVPKFIKIVPTIPRGATGKVSKPAIMRDFLQNPQQLPWASGRENTDTSRGGG